MLAERTDGHEVTSEPRLLDERVLTAELFYASERLRRFLGDRAAPVRMPELLLRMCGKLRDSEESAYERGLMVAMVERLVLVGLLKKHVRPFAVITGGNRYPASSSYSLSEDGRRSLELAAPAKPHVVPETGPESWAASLSREIAKLYGVRVHRMLRTGETGTAADARARLCGALYARGWSADRITRYFGMPRGWSSKAIASWKLDGPKKPLPPSRRVINEDEESGHGMMPSWAQPGSSVWPTKGLDGIWR